MLCDVTSLKEYQLHVLWVFVGTEGDCGLPATHVTQLVPPGKQKLAWTLSMLTFMKLCRQIFQRLFGAQVWIDSKEVLPRNDPHQTQENVDQTRVFWAHNWHSTFCMTCIEIITFRVLCEIACVVQWFHHGCNPNAIKSQSLDVIQLVYDTWGTGSGCHKVVIETRQFKLPTLKGAIAPSTPIPL